MPDSPSTDPPPPRQPPRRAVAWPCLAAGLVLLAFWALGDELLRGSVLDVGRSLNEPTPGHGRFLGLWAVFGGAAAALLATGLWRLVRRRDRAARLAAAWTTGSDRRWIVYGGLLAFAIPALLRTWVLGGARLTDDAAAYELMARLLASGRLYAESPPLKLFFDNRFLVNDGKLYAHYFLGWPALLAPGVWLGVTGYMNAVYSALTVPALYGTLLRLAGRPWARAGLLLYLASPMLMLGAATMTSHTSCIAALAWLTWAVVRAHDAAPPRWIDAAVAVAFSVAFFVRPASALGVGLPLLVAWAWRLRRRAGGWRRPLVAFVVPAALLAGLFLAVNAAQTGSATTVAYQRAFEYAAENDFRFSLWPAGVDSDAFTELRFAGPWRALAIHAAGLYRLQAALFGWPSSLLLAVCAGFAVGRRALWAAAGTFLLVHAFVDNVGIDTFAPMHFIELAWPLLLLSALGLERLTAAGRRLDAALGEAGRHWAALPACATVALVAVTAVGYLPVELRIVHRVAENVRMPDDAVREAGLEDAVVFAPDPFVVYCRSHPARGWVFARPNNDPDLEDPVLWVNHLDLEDDRRLMREVFPERSGWVMGWDGEACRVHLFPLDRLIPGVVRDATVRGLD